jgi:cell wall-associated NlpC family hydrolase
MTWDTTAQQVAIHAIGAVEASMDYGAVNPSDPISIGIFQWYGTRAAELLFNIQANNASTFAGVSATIVNDMSSHSASDTWWNNRYVTAAEINTLSPMLRQNVAIQSTMAGTDLETYRQAGESAGLNADTNSETMEFFVNMYNQSPRSAFRVLGQVGGGASLSEIYNACLNDSTLGNYKSRYQQVYTIIVNQDTTGVGDPTGNPPTGTPPPTNGNPTGNTQPTSNIIYVEKRSNQLYAHYKDGHVQQFLSAGANTWTAGKDSSLGGGPVTPPVNPPPDPSKAAAVVQWMIDHLNQFSYSQGPCRISPGLPCGYTDCSGCVREAYKTAAGMIIGTWTGDEYQNGTVVGTTLDYAMGSGPQDGDLIFLKWPNNPNGKVYDHVEMFSITQKGPNGEEILSHGGPGNGPVWQQRSYDFSYAVKLQVNRYL